MSLPTPSYDRGFTEYIIYYDNASCPLRPQWHKVVF